MRSGSDVECMLCLYLLLCINSFTPGQWVEEGQFRGGHCKNQQQKTSLNFLQLPTEHNADTSKPHLHCQPGTAFRVVTAALLAVLQLAATPSVAPDDKSA